MKDDSAIDNIVLENENQHRHSSRDANKNKIFASLICLTKSRSSANKDTLSATTTLTNNSAAKEKHRKQKDASRKERKATQTLAIVLGKFVQSICKTVLPTLPSWFRKLAVTYVACVACDLRFKTFSMKYQKLVTLTFWQKGHYIANRSLSNAYGISEIKWTTLWEFGGRRTQPFFGVDLAKLENMLWYAQVMFLWM